MAYSFKKSKLIYNFQELTNNLIDDLDGIKNEDESFSKKIEDLGETTLFNTMKIIDKYLFYETKKT